MRPGKAPILLEPVRGRVHILLTKPVEGATGYALDSVGKRAGRMDVVAKSNAVDIALTADAFWYEVVVAR